MAEIKVLLIDDNPDDRVLYRRLLSKSDALYDIRETGDASQALAMLEEDMPDCIILDYAMPEMNGMEFITQLKAHPPLASIPVLMLTGQGDEKLAAEAIKSGALDYLVKSQVTVDNFHQSIVNTIEKGGLLVQVDDQRKELEQLAKKDFLTGLRNRYSFESILNQELEKAETLKQKFAVLFLDVDDFKKINDEQGHDAGDLLLKKIAIILDSSVRGSDVLARFGGDEFAVLLRDIDHEDSAGAISSKIIDRVQRGVQIHDSHINVTVSIGISCFPEGGTTTQDLLKNADIAMYRAKGYGKNSAAFFTEALGKKVSEQLEMENSMRNAVDMDELLLVYQPIYDLQSQKVVGVESLIRWRYKKRELLLPEKFLPVAEDTGLIRPIGHWVLEKALSNHKKWLDMENGYNVISINVSASQVMDPVFIDLLQMLIGHYKLDPQTIMIELTETVVIHTEDVSQNLQKLHEIGVKIAIDDFGTGYSSLKHLYTLPIDVVKIDKSFVMGLFKDKNALKIIQSILYMAKQFDLEVVAEGIEEVEQLEEMVRLGCLHGQGFYLDRPILSEEVTARLV
ncbi:EAL domain-containing protein [Francisellaceae bacterium]|nr:EAL domain-containing protein [Francisellaceae bacterium]